MKIIKIWYLNTEPAEYTTDYLRCGIVHNWYGDHDITYLYSAEDAMQTFREYSDDYKKTWEKYGEKRVYPVDVCRMYALLVPVRDDVIPPAEAGDLFLPADPSAYDPMYLDVEHVDIIPEYEFPWGSACYTLFEDGEVVEGDGEIFDPHGYIARWKSAGWNEEVTEV
jgi:hypothetical protein